MDFGKCAHRTIPLDSSFKFSDIFIFFGFMLQTTTQRPDICVESVRYEHWWIRSNAHLLTVRTSHILDWYRGSHSAEYLPRFCNAYVGVCNMFVFTRTNMAAQALQYTRTLFQTKIFARTQWAQPSSPTSMDSMKSFSLPSTASHCSISATRKSRQVMTASSSISNIGDRVQSPWAVILHISLCDIRERLAIWFQAHRNTHENAILQQARGATRGFVLFLKIVKKISPSPRADAFHVRWPCEMNRKGIPVRANQMGETLFCLLTTHNCEKQQTQPPVALLQPAPMK